MRKGVILLWFICICQLYSNHLQFLQFLQYFFLKSMYMKRRRSSVDRFIVPHVLTSLEQRNIDRDEIVNKYKENLHDKWMDSTTLIPFENYVFLTFKSIDHFDSGQLSTEDFVTNILKTSRLNRIQGHHLFSAMDQKKNHSINIVDFITILADIDKDCFQEPNSSRILTDFSKTLLLGWNEDNKFPELYSDYIKLVYNRINSNGNSDMNLSEFISGIMKHTTFSVVDCIVLCSIFEQDGIISKSRFVYMLEYTCLEIVKRVLSSRS